MATQSDLDAISTAIATGATEVRFQDRTVRYASTDALIAAYAFLYNQLYGATGSSANSPVRQIRTRSSKGL
jgi:hypothetical protein